MLRSEFKRIAGKAVILLFTTCIVYVSLFFSVCNLKVRPGTSFFYHDFADYLAGRGDADILIMGNSKPLSSLSSSVMQGQLKRRTYNLSYRASNLTFTRDLLISYLNNSSRKPSVCIVEMSWSSFSKARLSYPHDKPQLILKLGNTKELLCAMKNCRQALVEMAAKEITSADGAYVDWWDGDPKSSPEVFDPQEFRVEKMRQVYPTLEAGIDSELFHSFKDIIAVCQRNNIKLILYSAPEAPVYTSYQKDKEMIKSLIEKTARDNGLEYFDFTVDGQYYRKAFDSMIFDSEHVRRADDFTRVFLSVLKGKKAI